MTVKPEANDDISRDYDELTYWLWATLRNAEEYLSYSAASYEASKQMFEMDMAQWRSMRQKIDDLRKLEKLSAYHFISVMGVLIRVLNRSQKLFPTIQSSYNRARHLMTEGKEIRDMIEHAYGKDGYLHGGGRFKEKFVRSGDGYSADATSTITKDDGTWLGNRLCVEKAVIEIQEIYEETLKLSALYKKNYT